MKRFVVRFLSLCLCGVVLMLLPACTGNSTDQRGNIGLNDDSSLDGIVKENGSTESTEHPEPTESTESPEPTETIASINFPEFSEPSELPDFPVSPDSWMVVDKAYALEEGESLPDKVTIIGMVVSVDTPWSDRNRNITVTIVVEDRKDEPIRCYRMKGEGVREIRVNDTITVTGTLQNNDGVVEFYEPDMVGTDGCGPEQPGLYFMSIVGEGLPGIPEWDPAAPEGEMAQVSRGIYVKTLAFESAGYVSFKFIGNGTWDTSWIYNVPWGGPDYVCPNMVITPAYGGLWDFWMDIKTPIILEFELDLTGIQPVLTIERVYPNDETRVKLYVQVPEYWGGVYAYTRDEMGPTGLGERPGTLMPKTDDWYVLEVSDDMTNLILNAKDGYYTTQDLILEGRQDVWIVVSEPLAEMKPHWADIFYYEPVVTQNVYRVVGDSDWLGNWNPAYDGGIMQCIGPCVYTKTFESVPAGDYEFQFSQNGCWDRTGIKPNHVTIDRCCDVTVTLNLWTGAYDIEMSYDEDL